MHRRPSPPRPGWSILIARVFGIPLRLHVTFLLLPVAVAWTANAHGQDVAAALVLVVLVVACIVLHELGHAAVAQRFGIRAHRVTMYPTGGIAWFDQVPAPGVEWKIAIAGPLVHVGIASLIGSVLFVAVGREGIALAATTEPSARGLTAALFWINLSLAAFNIVPAYPTDGGRILRAVLALRWGSRRATVASAVLGQVLALGLAVVAVTQRIPWLGILAGALFVGAVKQSRAERPARSSLDRWAAEAIVRQFETLAPDDLLTEAAGRASATAQQEFPVVDRDGRIRGILTRPSIYHGLHFRGPEGRVRDEMDSEVVTVGVRAGLAEILAGDDARPGRSILVLDDDRIVGMIPASRVREYAEIEAARNAEATGEVSADRLGARG